MKANSLPRVAWYDSPWRIAGRAVAIAVVTVLVLAAAALFAVPRLMGGTSLTILSGSMEPSLMPGDVIAVRGIEERDVCTEVGVNDIITFFAEPNSPDLITHRVVAKTVGTYPDGTNCRLTVQGDNNTAVDAPISPAQVRGVFMYGVPAIGWARDWFAQNPALVIGGFVAIALAVYAWGAIRGPKTRVVNLPTSSIPGLPPTPSVAELAPYPSVEERAQLASRNHGSPIAPATMIAGLTSANPMAEQYQIPSVEERTQFASRNHGPLASTMDPNEFTLRMRELDLREREIAIREAEAKAKLGSNWVVEPGATTQPEEQPQLLLVP